MPTRSPSRLLVIVGETASGKSALAIELALKFDGEIICADSRTIYKGMDIGTAKPSSAEQAKIRHHLLDVVEPDQKFSVADFKSQAEAAINDISSRGKLPIVVGGSGLYVDSVIYDFKFSDLVPPADRALLETKSIEQLQQMLVQKNIALPENNRNKRYLIRTLETGGTRSGDRTLRLNTLVVGISHKSEELHQRITTRIDDMFTAGLEVEVRVLAEEYGWDNEAMKSVGYREFAEYFATQQSLEETKARIIHSTLKLAKKQRTWFKRSSDIHWVTDSISALALAENWPMAASNMGKNKMGKIEP